MNNDDKKNKLSKSEVVDFIKKNKGNLSKKEISEAFQEKEGNKEKKKGNKLKRVIKQKMMPAAAYGIGALIVIVGTILLWVEHWSSMSSIFRVMAVFGVGLLAYLLVLGMETSIKASEILKNSLSVLASILLFAGGGVIAAEYFSIGFTAEVQLITASGVALLFLVLFLIKKYSLYFYFIVFFSTWALYSLVSIDFLQNYFQKLSKPNIIYASLTLLVSLIYLAVDRFLVPKFKMSKEVKSLLKFLGSLGLLLSMLGFAFIYNSVEWVMVACLTSLVLSWVGFKEDKKEFVLPILILSGIFWMFGILGLIIILIIFSTGKKDNLIYYILSSIIAGTTFIYAIFFLEPVEELINAVMDNSDIIFLLTSSLIHLSYGYIAYLLSEKNLLDKFSKLLYVVGSFGFIIPLFIINGIYGLVIWEIVIALAIIGLIIAGTKLNRKTILIPGSLLLAVHIMIISGRYFVDNIGWPITLVVAGFSIMGVGYLSYRLVGEVEEEKN